MVLAKQEGLLKKFKLTTTVSTSNMHLFDSRGVIQKFDTPEEGSGRTTCSMQTENVHGAVVKPKGRGGAKMAKDDSDDVPI
ncbi:hypothetical protein V6N11_070630 [Hibiscus sabdariffa]|uniref:Uncharacterized protein n=1 Tax=Hibiscus sabdariffa TaxID=183260 RepID=A0ABR2QG63_9ROSI